MKKLLDLARKIDPVNLPAPPSKAVAIRPRPMLGGRVVRKCVVEAA